MACSVYYSSYYGSTREYAEALAERLGTTAERIPELAAAIAPQGPIVVLSPAHGPLNDGATFVLSLADDILEHHPVALATVGMTLDEEAVAKDATAGLLNKGADRVARFYLPGRLNYSELSTQHAMLMKGLISALRLKPKKSDNEKNMIATYGEDVDRVDLSRLDPLVAWVEKNQP